MVKHSIKFNSFPLRDKKIESFFYSEKLDKLECLQMKIIVNELLDMLVANL